VSETTADSPALGLAARAVYPERVSRNPHWTERAWNAATGPVVTGAAGLRSRRLWRIVREAGRFEAHYRACDEIQISAAVRQLRVELRRHGLDDVRLVGQVFALVREMADRCLGTRHFDVQMVGGYALLNGMVAEMATGEGKTLTATLAASTAALAGIPVHVVTVNDYLAGRDSEWMRPLYEALGLRLGVVIHGQSPEDRRHAYGADITYATNKEIAFDYLRDRIASGGRPSELNLRVQRLAGDTTAAGRLLLRGLHFAIVDEADSVLVDEARTPLIISGMAEPDERIAMGGRALALSEALEERRHFSLHLNETRVALTEEGRIRAAELAEGEGGLWLNEVLREELIRQALAARWLFKRGEAYLVRDGKVEIVDEFTGRIMADRSWSEGLHQLIERKEGLEPTRPRVPLARITYQRFFRRYRRLAGMTGTAAEVAGELWSVFRLPVVAIATNRPVRRTVLRDRVFRDADAKWRAITARCVELHHQGRPVLLGTRSVAASEAAAHHLSLLGLPHRVLSAAQDRHEAEIIAEAGLGGRITVATNMAGRGTDIRLGPGVADIGGLHVIMSERHESGRIDRQLAGRCARQGEPGSFEAILALDDPLLASVSARRLAIHFADGAGARLARLLFRRAQVRAERSHARLRLRLLKQDEQLGSLLAFSGERE
jgi:preprotein translocase subunit SecA